MDGGREPYPRRPGEPDCRYYVSTGFCKFRTTCRFNHPLDHKQVSAKDEYPERLGQAECQQYLKTGFCKFGAVCKFHHPRGKARSTSPENLNAGEMESAIRSQSGWCRDGATGPFHHPRIPPPLPEPSSSNSEMSAAPQEEVEQLQSSEIYTSPQEMTEICSRAVDRSEPTTQSAAREVFPTGIVTCGPHHLGTSNHETTSNARSSSSFKLVSSHDDVQTQDLKTSEPKTKLDRQIEASKFHWTELRSRSDDSTGPGQSNREIYESLLQYPAYEEWFNWCRVFGVDFSNMVLGQKLAEGGEAEIFEVKFGHKKPSKMHPRFVLKVFKAGCYSMRDFQKQWLYRLPSEPVLRTAVVMEDDRFAYLLLREAIDLRRLIEVAQEDEFPLWNGKQTRLEHLRTYEPSKPRSHGCSRPVFSVRCARKLMFSIAWSMMFLHHAGVHRDLKSSNVLCSDWELDEDRGFSPKKWIHCQVADYETCSTGVMGTGFWRAPEILLQLKEKNAEVEFTRKADVYSFAMVCYEIFTGHVPFEGYERDDVGDVLSGVRPSLPNHVPTWIQDLICKCWHQDPEERPTFDDIYQQILREDQLDEWKHIGYNPIMKGPNFTSRVPLEGPENGGREVPIIPSNELCMICEKKRTHSN